MSETTFTIGGDRYEVVINYPTIEKVRTHVGVDLLNVFSDSKVLEELGDPITLINALRICTDKSCEAHGTEGDEAFASLFAGEDDLEKAREAFINALVNFSPSHQRKVLKKLVAAQRQAEQKLRKKMSQMVKTDEMEKAIDLAVNRLDEDFSNALQSLESKVQVNARGEN